MHLKRSDHYGQGVSMPNPRWPPTPKPASQPSRTSREPANMSGPDDQRDIRGKMPIHSTFAPSHEKQSEHGMLPYHRIRSRFQPHPQKP
jgi:hypothetical protein